MERDRTNLFYVVTNTEEFFRKSVFLLMGKHKTYYVILILSKQKFSAKN